MGAWHQDGLADWLSVVMWLWLWLHTSVQSWSLRFRSAEKLKRILQKELLESMFGNSFLHMSLLRMIVVTSSGTRSSFIKKH
jgi:hypothetical protein